MDKKIVIAIGRGKGSGGHYIGELLASRLGMQFLSANKWGEVYSAYLLADKAAIIRH